MGKLKRKRLLVAKAERMRRLKQQRISTDDTGDTSQGLTGEWMSRKMTMTSDGGEETAETSGGCGKTTGTNGGGEGTAGTSEGGGEIAGTSEGGGEMAGTSEDSGEASEVGEEEIRGRTVDSNNGKRKQASIKWKRKRFLAEKAENMRRVKQQRRSAMSGVSVSDDREDTSEGVTNRVMVETEEVSEMRGETEKNREIVEFSGLKSSPSSEEEDFTEEKAQDCFDDWVVSLPPLDRKMLAVALSETYIKRQKMKQSDAVIETASFVGLNEKTVRKYRREFFSSKGRFLGTKRGRNTRQ